MSIELFVATVAIFISFGSLIVGACSLWLQRKHNQLSVRPIGIVSLADYEDRLAISIKNAGIGPMIVKSIETSDDRGNIKEYPIDWMPNGIIWKTFRRGLENHAIMAGEAATLLEYVLIENKTAVRKRDEIRSTLRKLTIQVRYTDVYNKEQPKLIRQMDWFGRNIQ